MVGSSDSSIQAGRYLNISAIGPLDRVSYGPMFIRVVLADPYATFRASLRALLEKQPPIEVASVTGNSLETVRNLQEKNPDILIVEPLLFRGAGPEVVRQMNTVDHPTRPLALSRSEDLVIVEQMLEQGASGYLLKRDAPSLLIEALHGIARGENGWISPHLAGQLDRSEPSALERVRHSLTPREWEVMVEVARGQTNEEIGNQLGISRGTVKNYVHRILQKLEFPSRLKLIVWAHRRGLLDWTDTVPA